MATKAKNKNNAAAKAAGGAKKQGAAPKAVAEKGQPTFSHKGKTYAVKHGARIPGINDGEALTALEIATDEEAQTYLVENRCVGSIIEEVFAATDEEGTPATTNTDAAAGTGDEGAE